MLWVAVHLPQLSLEAFCATLPSADTARPVALVDDQRIVAVNAAARKRGVKAGLKRPTGLAICGDLLTAQADRLRDAAALQAVAHAALAFSPMVTLDGAATVLLDVRSTLRYFGGLASLLQRLGAALAPLGHRLQLATAPTPLGAALLARWRDDLVHGAHTTELHALRRLLDAAPVWMLGPGRQHWEAVQGMGLRTLADLRSLPRSGVARRFSQDILDELDHAYGERPDPRDALVPPPVFTSRLELYARADTSAQLLHGAGVLLARLLAWAGAQHARIAACTLQMHHEPQHRQRTSPVSTLRLEMAEPSADVAHLQMLLRERLGRAELPASTIELGLECRDLVWATPPNAELFPSRQTQAEGFSRLLERLRARLGDEQVLHVATYADHRPERASILQPVTREQPPPAPPCDPMAVRPVWLLPEPVALVERNGQPLLNGRRLTLLSDAERIETGWWDGGLVARDYHVAQADGGALVWVFRSRMRPVGEPQWFLQGRFG